MARLYRALAAFDALAHCPEQVLEHRMQDGDCVVFDNRRVLHGRTGYEEDGVVASRRRRLHGWYIDWDEIWSRINVLRAA